MALYNYILIIASSFKIFEEMITYMYKICCVQYFSLQTMLDV